MGGFASKTLTPQEMMKQYKREIDRACRELERERRKLEVSNDRLAGEIRKAAAKNEREAVAVMAKEFVRCKRHVTKFYTLRTYLQGIGLQLQTMKSTEAMGTAMKNATRAMVMVNKRMNLPQLQAMLRTFDIESDRMEMTGEVMGDMMDDVLAGPEEEEEADTVVQQVMEELKLTMLGTPEAPRTAVGVGATAAVAAAPARVATAAGAAGGAAGASARPPPGPGGPGSGGAAAFVPPPAPPSGPPSIGGAPPSDGPGGSAAAPTSDAAADLAARMRDLKK